MKRWLAFICISRQQKFKVRATEFYSVIGKGYREIWTCKYQGERHFSRACPSRLKRSYSPLGKLPLAFALIPYPEKTKKIINSFHDISLHVKIRRISNIFHATFILVLVNTRTLLLLTKDYSFLGSKWSCTNFLRKKFNLLNSKHTWISIVENRYLRSKRMLFPIKRNLK